MKLELHILQNFAPSNLNRGDTGAPKDCDLGGHRRARISSQCQKRAVREAFSLQGLLSEEELGVRTKRLVHRIAERLIEKHGYERQDAGRLAGGALEGVGLGLKDKGKDEEDKWKTQYLLFIPHRVIDALADLLQENHDELMQAISLAESADEGEGKKRGKKEAKKAAKEAYPKEVGKAVDRLLKEARGTADLALFGRMIADKAEWNVDAACQVAHAVSTNKVQMDFDFFTAVDDFKPDDTAGSDMMGTVQFNSSCYYRYAVLDVRALQGNLDQPEAADNLTHKTVDAFVRAFVSAIPTGMQNSMAAHNPPSYVLAVVRDEGQPVSLANAFLKPARPRFKDGAEHDLVDDSVTKLEDYLERLGGVLGDGDSTLIAWADRDLPERDGVGRITRLNSFFDGINEAVAGATS